MMVTKNSAESITCSDEVSFFEIIDALIKYKKIIAITTLLCSVIFFTYSYTEAPIYQSHKLIHPPGQHSVVEANIVDRIYNRSILHEAYITNYELINNKTHFFDENNLALLYCKQASNYCAKKALNIFISRMKFDKSTSRGTFKSKLGKSKTDEILDDYARYINHVTTKDVIDAIILKQEHKRKRIKQKISSLIKAYNIKVENELHVLNNAIILAKKLNYKYTQDIKIKSEKNVPLYFLGYEHLEARRLALLSRKSVEPYVPEIIKLKLDLENIKTINHKSKIISAAHVDPLVINLKNPIYPNKLLFLIFGVVVGLFISFLIIVFRCTFHAYVNKVV